MICLNKFKISISWAIVYSLLDGESDRVCVVAGDHDADALLLALGDTKVFHPT